VPDPSVYENIWRWLSLIPLQFQSVQYILVMTFQYYFVIQ
jgi:hypothetical protein